MKFERTEDRHAAEALVEYWSYKIYILQREFYLLAIVLVKDLTDNAGKQDGETVRIAEKLMYFLHKSPFFISDCPSLLEREFITEQETLLKMTGNDVKNGDYNSLLTGLKNFCSLYSLKQKTSKGLLSKKITQVVENSDRRIWVYYFVNFIEKNLFRFRSICVSIMPSDNLGYGYISERVKNIWETIPQHMDVIESVSSLFEFKVKEYKQFVSTIDSVQTYVSQD